MAQIALLQPIRDDKRRKAILHLRAPLPDSRMGAS
jgi:hypothetical protein